MYVLGFTGGIAAGKTARCAHLLSLAGKAAVGAAPIRCFGINVDKVGHESYAAGTDAYHALVNHFGKQILAECEEPLPPVDRKRLGPIVFADPSQLTKLNEIVWPAIVSMVRDELNAVNSGGTLRFATNAAGADAAPSVESSKTLVVMEAALLVECGLHSLCDEVWLATVDEAEAVTRIATRDGLPEEQAIKRIRSQASATERVAKLEEAKVRNSVFDTTGKSLEDGLGAIEKEFQALLARLDAASRQ